MTAALLAANDTLADTLVDRYIAAWNATDAARRRALVAQTWTESATYVDPLMQGIGHDGIEALIAGVQAKFPGFRFARDGGADVVQDTIRFRWTLGPEGQALVKGTDFVRIEGDRMQTVTGFIDQMPGMGGAG
ncbi:nuclear transport factor 2 family protein [Ralstonia pickettii]|uniref:nuclear transport factor 2 family protein n=1 Tax=Ralstonia pickettii TaxID=329 RepID=UPI0015BE7FBA|nr:nuclear transport factor 2 family protein [Ralstonia pickettii]NWK44045.1 nuclear transport factor 2 family protein [Ralstonia pickettii]